MFWPQLCVPVHTGFSFQGRLPLVPLGAAGMFSPFGGTSSPLSSFYPGDGCESLLGAVCLIPHVASLQEDACSQPPMVPGTVWTHTAQHCLQNGLISIVGHHAIGEIPHRIWSQELLPPCLWTDCHKTLTTPTWWGIPITVGGGIFWHRFCVFICWYVFTCVCELVYM